MYTRRELQSLGSDLSGGYISCSINYTTHSTGNVEWKVSRCTFSIPRRFVSAIHSRAWTFLSPVRGSLFGESGKETRNSFGIESPDFTIEVCGVYIYLPTIYQRLWFIDASLAGTLWSLFSFVKPDAIAWQIYTGSLVDSSTRWIQRALFRF